MLRESYDESSSQLEPPLSEAFASESREQLEKDVEFGVAERGGCLKAAEGQGSVGGGMNAIGSESFAGQVAGIVHANLGRQAAFQFVAGILEAATSACASAGLQPLLTALLKIVVYQSALQKKSPHMAGLGWWWAYSLRLLPIGPIAAGFSTTASAFGP